MAITITPNSTDSEPAAQPLATVSGEDKDNLNAYKVEIATLMGQCILNLQRYEYVLKQLVATSKIAGHPEKLESILAERKESVSRKTLGQLIKEFTGDFLQDETLSSNEDDEHTGDNPYLSFQISFEIEKERYSDIVNGLDELLKLRNELVHHFWPRFSLSDIPRCTKAKAYLEESLSIIRTHLLALNAWAKNISKVQREFAEVVNSPDFEIMVVHGVMPDGSVDWPASSAVNCLREAEKHFAVDGWTPLNTATAWINEQNQDVVPQTFGCTSWRQVIHNSQLFEIRRTKEEHFERCIVWYRSRS